MSQIVRPVEAGVKEALSVLEVAMPISLIATFELQICHTNNRIEEVLFRENLQIFDYIPVAKNDRIVGVLNRLDTAHTKIGLVREVMQPLDDSNLISANASLLSFVEDVDRHPYRLLLHGRRIVGIVTQSDLQKFAVRPVLFSFITCVELLLAEWLRQKYPNDKEWLAVLSDRRQTIIEERWIDWDIDKTAMDKVSVTEFCDKRDATLKLGAFSSKNATRKKLWDVEWLRHAVMHSADYALTQGNAERTARGVRYAREIIQSLQDSLV